MKSKYLFTGVLTFCSLWSFAQLSSVEISGNLNPTVNSTETYTAVFRDINGNALQNQSGTGSFLLLSGNLGTVLSSDDYSITIQWTSLGDGTIEYGFIDENNNNTYFTDLSLTVELGSSPPPPVASYATALTTTSFVANWQASSGASSYTLEVSLSGSFASIFRSYTNLTTLSQSVTSLIAGTTYFYRVRAHLDGNSSPNSNVEMCETIPDAPQGVATSSITQVSFDASWSAVTGAQYYSLDVSTDDFATNLPGYDGLIVYGTTATVTGLVGGTAYKWRVRAADGFSEESANSATSSLTTQSPTLSTPAITGITNMASTSFQVNWSSVSGATKYRIDVSTNSSFSSFVSFFNSREVVGTSQLVYSLSANTTYYFRVRALNSTETSGYSSTISQLTLCSSPYATAVSNATSQSFQANWDVVSGAESYQIDIATNSDFNPILSTITNLSTNYYLVGGLSEKTSYYYRVRAVNASGASANSNIVFALSFDHNYVRSIDVQVPGNTTIAAVDNSTVDEKITSYQFFDGLGRPEQTVLMNGSPQQKDIITPMQYDAYGREAKKFLPYVDQTEDNGWFKENAVREISSTGSAEVQYRTGDQYAFYQQVGAHAGDQYPYSETVFEPSPLNRVLKQGAPGEPWQPNTDPQSMEDKTVKMRYEFNQQNEVLLFKYDPVTRKIDPTENGVLKYYNPQELMANKTFDEHNNQVIGFVDKQGRTVLKKVQYATDETNNPLFTETYYIYDDLGNLVFVLPPEGVKQLLNAIQQN